MVFMLPVFFWESNGYLLWLNIEQICFVFVHIKKMTQRYQMNILILFRKIDQTLCL